MYALGAGLKGEGRSGSLSGTAAPEALAGGWRDQPGACLQPGWLWVGSHIRAKAASIGSSGGREGRVTGA